MKDKSSRSTPGPHSPSAASAGSAVNPPRHLDLKGSYNIRDLGGYRTTDGRTTRWRTLLRSGSMHALPVESQHALIYYGVRTVVDLRTTEETRAVPNVFSGSANVAYHHQNLIGDAPLEGSESVVGAGDFAGRIPAIYISYLERRRPRIAETLATLAEPGALPAIYHCAGGKDRTGIISALLLGLAGVPPETIAQDYALTARYLMDRYFDEQAPPGVTPESYTWKDYQSEFCPPEAMIEVLRHLDDRYGGIESYVRAAGLSEHQIESLQRALVD